MKPKRGMIFLDDFGPQVPLQVLWVGKSRIRVCHLRDDLTRSPHAHGFMMSRGLFESMARPFDFLPLLEGMAL